MPGLEFGIGQHVQASVVGRAFMVLLLHYYIHLTAFFQDSLGKPALEK